VISRRGIDDGDGMAPKISIIMPVYNEEFYIARIVELVRGADTLGWERELIIVNDGSTDGTLGVVSRLADGTSVKVFSLDRNRGKGCALRLGFEKAAGEILLIQDADFEYDVSHYPILLEPILAGRARVVYGSRFLGACRNMRWPNRLINAILRFLANRLYGLSITDEATGFKVFTRDVLDGMNLQCRRFEFCPEFTAKVALKGIPIFEVPITYAARTSAQGKKIRWYDAVIAVWTLVKYRLGCCREDLSALAARKGGHDEPSR